MLPKAQNCSGWGAPAERGLGRNLLLENSLIQDAKEMLSKSVSGLPGGQSDFLEEESGLKGRELGKGTLSLAQFGPWGAPGSRVSCFFHSILRDLDHGCFPQLPAWGPPDCLAFILWAGSLYTVPLPFCAYLT